ncbi:hypothetical protein O3G_MSEX006986 [Manduca sexta]|uniref:Uncharacterized protein n=1 Tax=Manduca sexta TaxID=7130 RepID=A0A922CMU0_MANSE|nr:hypothetical protein O3G_MSEX006986 [Manduca sexta]
MNRIMKTWISIWVIYLLTSTTTTSYTTQRPKKPPKVQEMRYITNWGKYKLPKVVHVKDLTKILEQISYYRQMKYCPYKNKYKCLTTDKDEIISRIIANYFASKINETQTNRNETAEIKNNNKKQKKYKKIKKANMTDKPINKSMNESKMEAVKKYQRVGPDYDFIEEPIFNHNYRNKRILKLELISEPSKNRLNQDIYRASRNEEFKDLTRKHQRNSRKMKKSQRFRRGTGTTPARWCDGRRRWIRRQTTKTTKVIKTTTSSDLS